MKIEAVCCQRAGPLPCASNCTVNAAAARHAFCGRVRYADRADGQCMMSRHNDAVRRRDKLYRTRG